MARRTYLIPPRVFGACVGFGVLVWALSPTWEPAKQLVAAHVEKRAQCVRELVESPKPATATRPKDGSEHARTTTLGSQFAKPESACAVLGRYPPLMHWVLDRASGSRYVESKAVDDLITAGYAHDEQSQANWRRTGYSCIFGLTIVLLHWWFTYRVRKWRRSSHRV